ncbi:tyrosine-type recombinase/integrase [Bacillus pumilus]|uniref:tyrosine-type recombinase/integrase n=1 Tax=Bacillus pumilus TaxID=1408 RepID=UPI001C22E864|nr:site-specific integrase [Bacillus pumilus]MBU8607820.1 tyrosine-type recombinase/integrase [Bacillus pumilus]
MNSKAIPLKEYTVYNDIMTYLKKIDDEGSVGNTNHFTKAKRRHGLFETNTAVNYYGDIKQFFKYIKPEVGIEFLTPSDIKITSIDIINFRKHLKEKGLANSTINRKVISVKGLYKFLKTISTYSSLIDLSQFGSTKKLKEISKSYGKTTQTEAERIADNMLLERENGLKKKLLTKFLIRTSFRIEYALTVRWMDIKKVDGELYKVEALNKGSYVVSTGLHENFLNELRQLRKQNSMENDLVFGGLASRSYRESFNRALDRLGIPASRNLKPHSLKGVGIDIAYEESGNDIRVAMTQGNHKDPKTPLRYLTKNESIENSAGILMDKEVDFSLIESASKEDFVNFFRKTDKSTMQKFLEFVR